MIIRTELKPSGETRSQQKLARSAPLLTEVSLHDLFVTGAKKVSIEYPDGRKTFFMLDPDNQEHHT